MREKNGLVYLAAVCIASATITACAGVDLGDKVATSLVATESNATKSSIDEEVSSLLELTKHNQHTHISMIHRQQNHSAAC